MPPFLLGINMPGAVSAGAYTAGVLDFLMEALDAWYAAKTAGQPVPTHEVSLEVFSGASAGGMCAAIASVMVQGEFDHIHDAPATGTSNRFYESWVNKIDIRELLGTDDLEGGGPVVSLLDSTIVDEIAAYALQPGNQKPRRYISPHLTLFLTLTNLTGIPYAFDQMAGIAQEGTLFHTDRLRFETVEPGKAPSLPIAKPLPLGQPDQGAWGLLREAAKATGAFPIFLAPRILERDRTDYDVPMWESVNPHVRKNGQIAPAWPAGMGAKFRTLNVDGGVIDNDPFDLAHDYLACLNVARNLATAANENPREMTEANAAVITVAPFPSTFKFNGCPTMAGGEVGKALGSLASVLITQSRFFGESLALMLDPRNSSRFMISPSDDTLPAGQPALQCASLGAFGGFFDRKFRAHDFLLGRRNCQWFLRTQFVLPETNPLIGAGLAGLSAERKASFAVPPEHGKAASTGLTLYPIIPLVTPELEKPIPAPLRERMGLAALDDIVTLIYERGRAVIPALAKNLPFFPRFGLDAADRIIGLFGLGKEELRELLTKELGDSI